MMPVIHATSHAATALREDRQLMLSIYDHRSAKRVDPNDHPSIHQLRDATCFRPVPLMRSVSWPCIHTG
jgi:hypothetical protein